MPHPLSCYLFYMMLRHLQHQESTTSSAVKCISSGGTAGSFCLGFAAQLLNLNSPSRAKRPRVLWAPVLYSVAGAQCRVHDHSVRDRRVIVYVSKPRCLRSQQPAGAALIIARTAQHWEMFKPKPPSPYHVDVEALRFGKLPSQLGFRHRQRAHVSDSTLDVIQAHGRPRRAITASQPGTCPSPC